MTLYPLAYAGGEVPEVNIGLMPCLVTTLRTGDGLEDARPIGQELVSLLEKRGDQDPDLDLASRRHGIPRSTSVVQPDDVQAA